MTGEEMVVFLLVLLCAASLVWLVCRAIPQTFQVFITSRMSHEWRKLRQIESRLPGTLAHEDVALVDNFMRGTVASPHPFGASFALSFMTHMDRMVRDYKGVVQTSPFVGLNQGDQQEIARIQARVLELLFCRAFLGSALWFVLWPGCLWAKHRFGGTDGVTKRPGLRPSTPDVLFPVEWAFVAVDAGSKSTRESLNT